MKSPMLRCYVRSRMMTDPNAAGRPDGSATLMMDEVEKSAIRAPIDVCTPNII